jgi:hypothetical protein
MARYEFHIFQAHYKSYPTFQATCAAIGLLEGDNEWDQCLEEAALMQTGHQLRQLFTSILLHNYPLNPRLLYTRHLPHLSDDCRHKLQRQFHITDPNYHQIESLALYEIDIILRRSAKSLADYDLPIPTVDFSNLSGIPRIIAEERNHNVHELMNVWAQGYQSATSEQRKILDTITAAVISGHGGLFFIDGPGGTGKTFVENLLLNWVRGNSQIALAVASSGIAANLLHHGRTSHSRFHIPLDIQPESLCTISAQSELAELLRSTSLIIWDEVSSQNRYCFEAVDRTLQDIRKNSEWFGGIPVVFAGKSISYKSFANKKVTFDNVLQLFQRVPQHKSWRHQSYMLHFGKMSKYSSSQ